MSKIRIVLTPICLYFLSIVTYGQDTVYLATRPKVIVKSWYPEFKEFPKLKIGESKILFTEIPAFEKTSIRDNDIDFRTSNSQVKIEETVKTNQYLITVNPTSAKFIEFELWLELDSKAIFLKENSKWQDIKMLYPIKGNRVLINKIKLELME